MVLSKEVTAADQRGSEESKLTSPTQSFILQVFSHQATRTHFCPGTSRKLCQLELATNLCEYFKIAEEAPTRALSVDGILGHGHKDH